MNLFSEFMFYSLSGRDEHLKYKDVFLDRLRELSSLSSVSAKSSMYRLAREYGTIHPERMVKVFYSWACCLSVVLDRGLNNPEDASICNVMFRFLRSLEDMGIYDPMDDEKDKEVAFLKSDLLDEAYPSLDHAGVICLSKILWEGLCEAADFYQDVYWAVRNVTPLFENVYWEEKKNG